MYIRERIKRAKLFSTRAHKNQFRKDGITPYIKHPIDVVNLLIEWGLDKNNIYDVDVICAAYLHDTIEENENISYLKLERKFNSNIAEMVAKLTKNIYEDKEDYINRISSYDLNFHNNIGVLFIKCADRICNIKDFIKDDNQVYAKKYYFASEKIFYKLFPYITKNHVVRNIFNSLIQIKWK